MGKVLPLLIAAGATALILGGKKSAKKSFTVIEKGDLPSGGKWRILHFPKVGYIVDLDFGKGWVALQELGLAMAFKTAESAKEIADKILAGTIAVTENGSWTIHAE